MLCTVSLHLRVAPLSLTLFPSSFALYLYICKWLLSPTPSLPLSPQYLSNADERLKWQASALPTDDLCTENAIMIKRFNRYPLVVDPSGQATEFIMNEYKDRKITRTRFGTTQSMSFVLMCLHVYMYTYMHPLSIYSFLDDAFRKNLESALRFGNPLLVQVHTYMYIHCIYIKFCILFADPLSLMCVGC